MILFLLQGNVEEITQEIHFRWLVLPPLWVLAILLVPAVIALVALCYRGETDLLPRQRWTLAALRGLAIALVLMASFRPAWETTRYANEKRQIHVLVDDSASMGRRDSYLDPATRAALDTARGSTGQDSLDKITRSELVRAVLSRKDGLTAELGKSYDVHYYRFSRRPLPIRDLSELRAQDSWTRIGDALDLHLAEQSGDLLEAVILVSDGRNNEGMTPEEAARKYRAADIRVHTVGVGDPAAARNVAVVGPSHPKEGLVKEELRFEATVTAQGYEGKDAVLQVRYKRSDGGEVRLDPRPLRLLGDNVPLKVEVRHTFDEPGDYTLSFEVPPFPDETHHDDNVDARYLRIEGQKIKVLYLEGLPRWEYRFLKNALLRVDEAVQVQCYLFSATKRFPQERSKGMESLTAVPRTRQELFQYHVVILGDVSPEDLGGTEDEFNAWLKLLAEFVELGGGVCFQASEFAMPSRYLGTPVMDLLPVVPLDIGEAEGLRLDMSQPFTPLLEDPNRPHEVVQFDADLGINARLWSDGFQGFQWYFPVKHQKAGAEVLLRHPAPEHANKYGKGIVAAAGFYPRGRTFWIGTDEIWRWRKPYGEKYYDRFWRNVVRWLAEEKLRRLNDKVELQVDRKVVEFGQPVRVLARIKDENYAPKTGEEQPVFVRAPGGTPTRRALKRSAAEPGTFEGTFSFHEAGMMSFLLFQNDNPAEPPTGREDVLVRAPDRELNPSSLDETTLKAIAQTAGGRYLPLGSVDELASDFRKRGMGRRERDRTTREMWDTWTTLLMVVGCLAAEWALRKRYRLI